ncbi:MAG: ral secretion pathway protein [Polaromonas sp.]|nr:ral secretion pathway protein [Polaromonas sp.]
MLSIAGCAIATCATGLFSSNLQAQPQPRAAAGEARRGESITLNFVNANIDAVARTMATLTGRNVVVDPRVKGTITLTTERPVSPAAAYNQFLAILRLQGFTVVNAAGLDKIVPEADAKLQGGSVSTNVPAGGGQIATTIFKLSFENANNLLPILRPLISPNNTINVNPGNNSLIITDYADNLSRLGRIIAALDVANATDAELIPVHYASVTDLAPLISRLLDSSAGGVAGTTEASYRTTVIAEPRSNSLIVRAANGARLELVKSLVRKLDTPTLNGPNGDAGNIYVVYLKNAEAASLATVLRAAMTGTATSTGASGQAPSQQTPGASSMATLGGAGGANQSNAATAPITPSAGPSTGGQIQADPATNSLIITASEPQYRQLRAVIEKLDARRAQVYVESLIAEVNMDKAAEFGIQWQGPIGGNGDRLIGLLGTNFGAGGKNIINLATQGGVSGSAVAPSTGLNLGVAARSNGVYFLGFLANFLQTSGAGNILSTPNLLTLDNEEAKIVIGQNVPFVTGQFTNTGGGGNGSVNPFQTIERKDVGLTLRVKPQISENGTVKMAIFQEVSSVQPGSVNSATGLITNKRSIESNVLVEDGSIIVIGGLLQDEYSGNQEKVPVLGDVPVLGNLFKSESRTRKKTNLMVFLRPVVVRDGASTDALSMGRYDFMRTTQQQTQPPNSSVVPVNESPVLPAQPGSVPALPAIAPAEPAVPQRVQSSPPAVTN